MDWKKRCANYTVVLIEIDKKTSVGAEPVLIVLVFGMRCECIRDLSTVHHEIVNFPARIVSRRSTQDGRHFCPRHSFRDAVELLFSERLSLRRILPK